ncbi:MAG: amidohydrolase family protein [Rubrivivax sp.]|nr:amidohydrolase family protein [Rubrivivax sp.]
MKRRDFSLGAAALLAGAARASEQVPPPPQRVPLLVTNATLHPVAAPDIANGRMLVDGGRIVALAGPGQPLPATATPPQVLDLGGAHVYPGFIAASSTLGLVEVSGVAVTVDSTERAPISPGARALVAINPDSELLPVARSNGVLTALVTPQGPAGGGISGTSALVQLDGWTWEDMALVPEAALHVALPSLRLADEVLGPQLLPAADELRRFAAQRLRLIDEAFDTAAAYARARAATPTLPRDPRWDAMAPVLRGERPLFVHANELAQIRHALALAERHRLKLVIVGGADAPRIADVLRERDVAVIVGGVHLRPLRRDEDVDARFRVAARLHAAGVRFAIARAGGAASERNLPYEAASAAAHGLPRDEALKAITLYPAQILGVAERLGALAPGRLASFFVTDGDPLETPTQVQRLFVQGRELAVDNKQIRLADKYRQRYEQLKPR